jgi:hypothetical protein
MNQQALAMLYQNKAVLGIPKFLNTPNTTLTPSQTLDGYDISSYSGSTYSPYPSPINLNTQYQHQNDYGRYVAEVKLGVKSFNYYRPDYTEMAYADKLWDEYGVALTAEQTVNNQNQIKQAYQGSVEASIYDLK